MSQIIPIFVPTYISDQNYNPSRVQPRLLYYNGQVDCQSYYLVDGTGLGHEETQFPYFDNYSVVSGSQFPTSGSNSLLFFNEQPSYGTIPEQSLFSQYWSDYVNLLYNPRTRLINASAIIPLADYFKMELNDVVEFRGNYYHLRAINDYNLKNGNCKIQLLGPILPDSLPFIQDAQPVQPTTTTTTTTIAPATVKIHVEEYNESPTAFFDLNVFANGESFFFSGDFTQSVAPNTSIVEMEVSQNSPSQNWGPYLTASATMTITDNGSNIFNNTSTYTSGSATYSVTSSVNFLSGHQYIISASNQPFTTTTTTTTTTTAATATLAWSYSETGGAVGVLDLYVNGSIVETRTNTSNGTYTVNVGDTINVELNMNQCTGGDNYSNVYCTGIITDADCTLNGTAGIFTSVYTVVSGDIGTTLNLDTFASCDGGCI